MNKINKECYQFVWKEFFLMGCNYKYICLKTGLSFFQFKNVCKRLACYNYSLVNTHFLKDFERKYKIDLYSRTKFDSKGRRPQFQFTLFEDELEVAQRKKMILKRYHQVLKMEKKMIEDIREDLQGAILRQKEISRKHHVSEYFVLSCRTERKKRVVKNHVVVKTGDTTTKIPLHKKERVLKFLHSWFDGRVITLTIQEDLSKFDVLGLVQDGKIKEALKRIELT